LQDFRRRSCDGGTIAVSLAPKNLKRYKDIAWLLVKYGRADRARGMGLESETAPGPGGPVAAPPEAAELARDLAAARRIALVMTIVINNQKKPRRLR